MTTSIHGSRHLQTGPAGWELVVPAWDITTMQNGYLRSGNATPSGSRTDQHAADTIFTFRGYSALSATLVHVSGTVGTTPAVSLFYCPVDDQRYDLYTSVGSADASSTGTAAVPGRLVIEVASGIVAGVTAGTWGAIRRIQAVPRDFALYLSIAGGTITSYTGRVNIWGYRG